MLPQTDRASVTICVTKILGALGPPPLDGGVADPRNTSVSACYLVKCGRSGSNEMTVIMEIRRNLTFKVARGHWNRHGLMTFY